MAAHKKRKRTSASHRHRVAAKSNGKRRRRYGMRSNPRRRRYAGRRNPMGGGIKDLFTSGLFVTVGAVGSKLLTQVILGSNNTGIYGYGGNAAAGLAIGLVADKVLHSKNAAYAVYVGTAVQIILRLISDYTPYGQALSLSGMGDYQVANFVTPQRYVDGLHSAQIQIPAGWGAPPVVVSSSSVPAGHSGGGLSGAYSGGGAYSVH